MTIEFTGIIWFWKGPSPFFFVSVPPDHCTDLHSISQSVTYGWGMIPATVTIGETVWTTSLFPKDGGYLVPIKDKVRRAEGLNEGDTVTIRLKTP